MLLLAGLLATAGCGERSRPAPSRAMAFPAEPPAAALRWEELFGRQVVRRFDFDAGLPPDWFIVLHADSAAFTARGLRFAAPRPGGAVEWRGRLDAATVDALTLGVDGLVGAAWVEVDWTRVGAAGGEHGHLETSLRDLGEPGPELTLRLAGHPLWRGTIATLRLRLANPHGEASILRSVALEASRLDRDALGRAGAAPWRIDAGNEVRSGYLLSRERPVTIPIPGQSASRLRFGAWAPGSEQETLSVALVAGGSPAAASSRLAAVGLEGAPGRWIDHVVEIPASRPGAERKVVLAWDDGAPEEALAAIGGIRIEPAGTPPDQPDVLMISIDTLRADRTSLLGGERPTTPSIDAFFAQGGVIFEQAWASAPSTLPSHASLFTGLDALVHGAYLDQSLGPGPDTLAQRLEQAGWESIAVTGGGYLHPAFGLDRGFSRYAHFPRRPGREEFDLESGVARVARLLGERDRGPRFVFLHTYDVHAPYRPRSPWAEHWGVDGSITSIQPLAAGEAGTKWPVVTFRDGSTRRLAVEQAATAVDLYDSGIAASDRLLSPLLDRSLERPTLVVLLADHGESFGERGRWEHGYLTEDNLRVPLAFRLPGASGPARRVENLVSLVDVLPTVLALVGVAPPERLDGVSLASEITGGAAGERPVRAVRAYSAETGAGLALRRGAWKLVFRDALAVDGERATAWNLERDPGELEPVAARQAGEPTGELLREAAQAIGRGSGGERLELVNREAHVVRVVLAGPSLRAGTVAWTGGALPDVARAGEGRLELELPARSSVRLRLSSRDLRGGIEISLQMPGKATGAASIVPSTDGARLVGSAGRGPEVELRLEPSALAGGPGSGRRIDEAEMQLRGLGYL